VSERVQRSRQADEPNWLEWAGVLIVVSTVIGVADFVLWLVGGEHLEIWIWRLTAVMALTRWIYRRMGWGW
jgi:hypothetical protein